MASIALALTPISPVSHRPRLSQSQPPISSQCISPDRGSGLSSKTTYVHLAKVYSTGALFPPSSPRSNHPNGKPSVASPAGTQTLGDNPRTTPQLFGAILEAPPVPDAPDRRDFDSNLYRPPAWRRTFSMGCLSYANSDMYAEHLVSCAPWVGGSAVELLVGMFREEYSRVFISPWIEDSAASRVTRFLESVQKFVGEKKGKSTLAEFQETLRKTALGDFDLTVRLGRASNLLKRSCFLGALFIGGLVFDDDIVRALGCISRLANCEECYQAYYYLLNETILELSSHAGVIQELQQQAKALKSTLDGDREPYSSQLWCVLIDMAIAPYSNRVQM